eukprot:TRINITY_DN4108_c0_g1_i6.p2 TRINITY_DN4108_c0_g1~~TRINITY_DN4108_c0_g1_i6.p2  ORF type:complete len:382 (+),score=90.22 TRINITY_DN4108_c0_g1_i6:1577-2722(+)
MAPDRSSAPVYLHEVPFDWGDAATFPVAEEPSARFHKILPPPAGLPRMNMIVRTYHVDYPVFLSIFFDSYLDNWPWFYPEHFVLTIVVQVPRRGESPEWCEQTREFRRAVERLVRAKPAPWRPRVRWIAEYLRPSVYETALYGYHMGADYDSQQYSNFWCDQQLYDADVEFVAFMDSDTIFVTPQFPDLIYRSEAGVHRPVVYYQGQYEWWHENALPMRLFPDRRSMLETMFHEAFPIFLRPATCTRMREVITTRLHAPTFDVAFGQLTVDGTYSQFCMLSRLAFEEDHDSFQWEHLPLQSAINFGKELNSFQMIRSEHKFSRWEITLTHDLIKRYADCHRHGRSDQDCYGWAPSEHPVLMQRGIPEHVAASAPFYAWQLG